MSAFNESSVLEVVEKVSRSVVNVNTVRLLHDFYYQVVPLRGMGSGTIIDPKGYVLTNQHVIEGAEEIRVTLASGETHRGKLVGRCTTEDIAILKISGDNLPTAELGDSDSLKIGQTVFAIGNPFGLAGGPTVTRGVVSAVKRSIKSDRGLLEGLVQTDAAINPGNSGGPLVDAQGRIIAINTAIVPFAQGIGFAVPVNLAKRCYTEITTHGKVIRPWLGISGLTVTPDMASYYNLPTDVGALISQVAPDSPAERAGVLSGDVIVGFDGKKIGNVEDLVAEIRKKKVGDKVKILLNREGREWETEAAIEETP